MTPRFISHASRVSLHKSQHRTMTTDNPDFNDPNIRGCRGWEHPTALWLQTRGKVKRRVVERKSKVGHCLRVLDTERYFEKQLSQILIICQ